QRSNGFGLTAGRNDEILTRWNLEKILTNRVRGIDSNPLLPNIKMFDVSENNGKILKNLNTCDAIFLYTDYLNHGLYYRVMSEISNKDKIFYLDNHVNMNLTIKRIYDLLSLI
ncbi:hypothetical protein ACM2QL_11945, partial [Enterococcus faecium]